MNILLMIVVFSIIIISSVSIWYIYFREPGPILHDCLYVCPDGTTVECGQECPKTTIISTTTTTTLPPEIELFNDILKNPQNYENQYVTLKGSLCEMSIEDVYGGYCIYSNGTSDSIFINLDNTTQKIGNSTDWYKGMEISGYVRRIKNSITLIEVKIIKPL